MKPLMADDLEERSKALRDAFPDMPDGDEVLADALIAAAARLADEAPQTGAEDERPE